MTTTNWWIWERPATLHIIYEGALAIGYELKKKHGKPYAKTFYMFFKDGMVRAMCDFDELISNGKEVIKTYLENKDKNDQEYNQLNQELISWFKKLEQDLTKLSDQEFLKIYSEFDLFFLKWWGFTQVAEHVSYGGEAILKENLTEEQFKQHFTTLVTPTEKSYTNEEEEELFEVSKNPSEEKLEKHAKRWHWLQNNYYDTIILGKEYFRKNMEEMQKVNFAETIKQNEERLKEIKLKKQELIKQLNLEKIEPVIWLIDEFCIFQDYRKKLTLEAVYYIDQFCKEVSRRKNIPYKILRNATPLQIKQLLQEKEVDLNQLKQQGEECVMVIYDDTNTPDIYVGEEAIKKEREVLGEPISFDNITEFEGQTANGGRAQGKVRVLLSPREIDQMQEGEILVTTMTTPDFVQAMRKAAAIVTDEGGITCHAAIVSRELGIPCVIGTKKATKVLNTGDLVDVKANHGLIHIL